ncbi:hypothetical protein U879_06145 [Defluviimonas sp. 20V17]|uniref:Uncharacterized protein n=1 Tax=Allgaiera indica TaxID=765699 RepID=A0AAN4ZZA1_9RHOB|nr:hypothetical protein [Allgaiera indica]KDB04526.1 hypothetical protein U879_06145 [Defluviimonas sp. 20V17]GHD99754.1 hypothetical protein GCM10008024_08400 [Allgaiera indica]SDW19181.1 hypothetical protein SAMN05444006_10236 [Allgaiera indica]
MALIDDIAEALSAEAVKAIEATGDDRFHEKVAKVIGTSSTTLEEAFNTSMRLRLAERRARQFIEAELAKASTRE